MKNAPSLKWSVFKKCPLCWKVDFRKRYDLQPIKVYECASCKIKFLNPYLSQESMVEAYASIDALKGTDKKLSHYYDRFEGSETEKFYYNCLHTLQRLKSGGTLLDIGCGRGQFLSVARKFGWSVTGLEPAEEHASFTRNQLGVNVICSSIEGAHLQPNSFDVVTLWDVIEHVGNPRETILAISDWLKPGGLLLVATPNHKGLLNFLAEGLFLFSGGLVRSPLNFLFVPEHVLYFTPSTLRKLLKETRFQIVREIYTGTDIDRYTVSSLVKIVAKILLPLARIIKAENRMIVFAKKLEN